MTDHTLPNTPRKTPSIPVLVAVFVVTFAVSGVGIFLLLDNLIADPEIPTLMEVAQQTEGGVTVLSNPREVMDFTFPSHTGEPISLSDLRGQHVLLYFGYTGCPDVCPLTFMDMQKAREALGEQADEVAYLFVSVDPDRDQPERIARYFDTRGVSDFMLGMTGDRNRLRQISPDYGLYFEAQPPEDNGYYTVDHTASLFLLDDEGRLTKIFAFGTDPDVIADAIRQTL